MKFSPALSVAVALSVSVVFSVAATESAFAYIPPSQFIVRNIVNKRKDIKFVRVRSVVSTVEGDKAGATRFVAVTTFNQAGVLKSWALGDNNVPLYGLQRRGATLPPVDSVLFESRIGDFVRSLRDSGIPIRTEDELRSMKDEDERRGAEVEHLERWKSIVAWVIGRKIPPDTHDLFPQFWVEKDTFYPMRLIFGLKGQDQGETADVRFDGQKNYRGFPFPRLVTVFGKDGVPWLRDEVIDIVVNPKSDDVEELPQSGYTQAASLISPPLRDLIDKYYETVR
jgi:hypothetical protein